MRQRLSRPSVDLYKVGAFETGHYISFDRVPDYWGKDLAVNVGQANFDRVRFEYFGDRKVAFEAFKAGVFAFREELTSAVWATGYDFAAVKDGRIIRATLPDKYSDGNSRVVFEHPARQVQGCKDQRGDWSCLRFRMDQHQYHVWLLFAHDVIFPEFPYGGPRQPRA